MDISQQQLQHAHTCIYVPSTIYDILIIVSDIFMIRINLKLGIPLNFDILKSFHFVRLAQSQEMFHS